MVTTVDIRSGSLGGISSGSIGILEQPLAIHGTVDIQSDITIGTVNIAGTLTVNVNAGSLGQINNVGSITTLSNFLFGGTIQNLNRLETAGTLAEVYRLGSIGNLGTLDSLTRVGSIGDLAHLTSGSIGVLSGSITTVRYLSELGSIGIIGEKSGSAINPADSTIITSGTYTLLDGNVDRRYARITLISTASNDAGTFNLALGGSAIANKGISLTTGGIFEINQLNLWRGTVSGIRSGASSGTLSVGISEY